MGPYRFFVSPFCCGASAILVTFVVVQSRVFWLFHLRGERQDGQEQQYRPLLILRNHDIIARRIMENPREKGHFYQGSVHPGAPNGSKWLVRKKVDLLSQRCGRWGIWRGPSGLVCSVGEGSSGTFSHSRDGMCTPAPKNVSQCDHANIHLTGIDLHPPLCVNAFPCTKLGGSQSKRKQNFLLEDGTYSQNTHHFSFTALLEVITLCNFALRFGVTGLSKCFVEGT